MDRNSPDLTVKEQCALLGLARSTYYYQETGETVENLDLMKRIDELHTSRPFLGRRKLAVMLSTPEKPNNPKRVGRLMKLMGLETLYPKPKLSIPGDNQRIWPYLLRGVAIEKPDQVWSSDITYIRLRQGFLYLTAVSNQPAAMFSPGRYQTPLTRLSASRLCKAPSPGGNLKFSTATRELVHQREIHLSSSGQKNPDLHGRPGQGLRQHLHRKALEVPEVRRSVPERLRQCHRSGQRNQEVVYVL